MLNKICLYISQNKNVLMLISASIYILAIFATLSDKLLIFIPAISFLFIFLLLRKILPIKYIITWTLLFVLAVANTSIRIKKTDPLLNLAPCIAEITGTIISIPQKVSDKKIKFFFDVKSIKLDSDVQLFENEKVIVTLDTFGNSNPVKLYDSGVLQGRLSIPFKAGNPSQFDYGNYLRNYNVYAVFYANNIIKINEKIPVKFKILKNINDYRENILNVHSKYLSSPNLEILGGIVFGDDAVSPPKVIKDSFANSGLLHILAASGMNVAFIYTFFFWIFTRLKLNFKLSVVLGMLTVVVYTFMTGLGASIIRAATMLLFVLLGKLIDRDSHSISLLFFVGLLMLIYNPLFINDVGFQLSFIVTFGILLMAPAIVRSNNKILNYLLGVFFIPVIAQLWIIPIQIFYFNNISLYSIFANIMSVPILMVISFGGFVSALLSLIQPLSDFVCASFDYILNPFISVLVNISDFWGHLPNSSLQTTHPKIIQILLYYLMLLSFTGLLYKEIREKYFKKILLVFSILFILWAITLISFKNSNLEILTFDVGNADSFLIKTPQNEYIMIDTGRIGYKGGKSQMEIIILKYLKDRGINKINSLIVTHFDNDHAGGAVDLLNNVNVDKLFVNTLNHESTTAKNIYETARNRDVKMILAKNLQVVYDENDLKIFNLIDAESDNDNDNSIMTILKYNDFTMFFTGDVSIASIKNVINYIPANIKVLKVPHHGALGGIDREILNHINPVCSIISVGENKFGHPASYILALLEKTKIFRTDIDNSILIKVDKKGYKVFTYNLFKRKYL